MSLADRYDGFLVDLDGVVWRGDQPIAGAAETIARLRDEGKAVVFLTNNASLSPREYAAKLMRHRIPTRPGDVISSAHAVVDYLRRELRLSRGDRVHVCGTPGLGQVLRGAGFTPVSDADAVGAVVVAWNPKLGFDELRRAADLARAGVPLVGANRDATYPTADGLLPGTGAILAAIEVASGKRAHAVGKPAPELFRAALEHAGSAPDRTLVLGDRLDTDIAGAHAAGLAGALVLTGVTTAADLDGAGVVPDWILDRLDDLVREGARPGASAEPLVQERAAPAAAERHDQEESRDEAADVREDGDPAGSLALVPADRGQELADEPQPDDDPRGSADGEEEEPQRKKGEDPRAGPQHDVRAEHAGDRTGRADDRQRRVEVGGDEDERRDDAADEVEDQEAYSAESIFDVVPEDPEEQHVESQVEDVRVHEHRREKRDDRRTLGEDPRDGRGERGAVSDETAWDQSVPVDEGA
jgi:4-nitrophenyl phosphatase